MIDIDQSGAIEVRDGRAETVAIFLLFWPSFGWPLFVWPIVALAHRLAVWPAAAYLVALTGLLVAGCYRSWQVTLLISDDGLLIRNLLRSWRVGWPQVAQLVDGYREWSLNVLLADGRVVPVTATAETERVLGNPRTLSVLRGAAAAHGVRDGMTGIAASRPRAWEDAAASVRWYKVRLAVWLAVAVGGMAGLVVVVAWNYGHTAYGPVFLPLAYALVAAAAAVVTAGRGWWQALQPEPGRRAGFGEGDWFAVPLRRSRYAVGLIARRQQRGRGAMIGCFFAPFDSPQPSLDTVRELRPADALLVALIPMDCIRPPGPGHSRSWPLLGRAEGWDRSAWPVPVFMRIDPKTGQRLKVYHDDQFRLFREDPEPVDPNEAEGLPAWGLVSRDWVIASLERRLKEL